MAGFTASRVSNALVVMAAIVLLAVVVLPTFTGHSVSGAEPVKIGFIGAMTGSEAKYGSFEATVLAVDEINAAGGINGRRVQLVAEDGKCRAKEAATAAQKLVHVDGVKIILGGHCSPETMAIAPIAEQNGVLMLSSITTSPK
ncbi:MAG: ABC transporter substrate-binding protein, partial [Candidatus Micrarchaeota archaeon]